MSNKKACCHLQVRQVLFSLCTVKSELQVFLSAFFNRVATEMLMVLLF